MTKHTFCTFAVALFLASCSNSKHSETQTADEQSAQPEAPKSATKKEAEVVSKQNESAEQPKPVASVVPAPAPAPEKPAKFTVGSTVWAAARISLTTDEGIFSVMPGKPLQVTKVTATGYVVTDGKNSFDVMDVQVTADVKTTAVQSEQPAQPAGAETERARIADMQQRRADAAVAEQAAAADRRRKELSARLDALNREEAILRANLDQAEEQDRRARSARYTGRTYSKTISSVQETAWNARLAAVKSDMRRLEEELARL